MTAVEEAGTTEKFSWEVTYVLNGGTNSILNPDRITTKTPLPMELYSPYRAGYNFRRLVQRRRLPAESGTADGAERHYPIRQVDADH